MEKGEIPLNDAAYESWRAQDQSIGNDTYIVKLKLSKPISQFLPISGRKVRIYYNGIRRICYINLQFSCSKASKTATKMRHGLAWTSSKILGKETRMWQSLTTLHTRLEGICWSIDWILWMEKFLMIGLTWQLTHLKLNVKLHS